MEGGRMCAVEEGRVANQADWHTHLQSLPIGGAVQCIR